LRIAPPARSSPPDTAQAVRCISLIARWPARYCRTHAASRAVTAPLAAPIRLGSIVQVPSATFPKLYCPPAAVVVRCAGPLPANATLAPDTGRSPAQHRRRPLTLLRPGGRRVGLAGGVEVRTRVGVAVAAGTAVK